MVLANLTLFWWGSGGRRRVPSGCGHPAAPRPPLLGRCGEARVPSGCPLRTSPPVKLIAAKRNLVLGMVQNRRFRLYHAGRFGGTQSHQEIFSFSWSGSAAALPDHEKGDSLGAAKPPPNPHRTVKQV